MGLVGSDLALQLGLDHWDPGMNEDWRELKTCDHGIGCQTGYQSRMIRTWGLAWGQFWSRGVGSVEETAYTRLYQMDHLAPEVLYGLDQQAALLLYSYPGIRSLNKSCLL